MRFGPRFKRPVWQSLIDRRFLHLAGDFGPGQTLAYGPALPTSVFLNPLGIVNAASYAPATNSVAPYEMVTLFGSNMSSGSAVASSYPLPTTLSNTQVLVNGVAAPLVAVSPTQITAVVPSGATPDLTAYASFAVANNGTASNRVTMYTNYTAPGIFSVGQSGTGPAAAEGAGYNLITAANPAKPGNVLMLFLTGMGTTTPSLADGVQSSPTGQPLNWMDLYNNSALFVYLDTHSSPSIQFAGVAPGYSAGLFQINFQIPSGVSNGNDSLDILTPDGETDQVTVNIAGASAASTEGVRQTAMGTRLGSGRSGVRRKLIIPAHAAPVPR